MRKTSLSILTFIGQTFILGLKTINSSNIILRKKDAFINNFLNICNDSIPIIFIISIFTGVITAWQAAYLLQGIAPISLLGATTSRAIISELSPVFVSLVLAGRIGGSIAAELSSMRITEQIEALELMPFLKKMI